MSAGNMKDLRKQLRTVVKELLPETTNNEQFKQLESMILARLNELEQKVKVQLSEMNTRHSDVMGYLVRSVSTTK